MNTRAFIKIDENEQEYIFDELPKEDEQVFRNYIEESRHFQEITQLYKMLLFDLDEIFLHYELHFDDRVFSLNGKEINILHINALVGNAVSAARTLIESMEVFDREYIDSEGNFKKKYISRAYDDFFSYRFIDFIRNYLQHGHVPISFDGEKIFFQLSEILDVSHMNINASLKKQMGDVEQKLFDHGEMNTCLTVIPMLYEYFLLIQTLVHEFFRFIKMYFLGQFQAIQKILEEHPEYISDVNGNPFIAVYLDEAGMLHGFSAEGDVEGDLDQWIDFAGKQLRQYESNNGHLFYLKIHYCLENRMPVMCMVDDDMLSENLETFCLKTGSGIHHLSFDTYYGKMEMNAAYRLYPYIQFKDGVRWNVPYQEVTVADFIRTFPQVKKTGLEVYANNVGGADDFFQRMFQDWSAYLCNAKIILANIGIHSPIDVLDWASRIVFVWQGMQLLGQSFSKSKKHKPFIRDLRNYIRQREEWNLAELENHLHARGELLKIILEEQGYVRQSETIYRYDHEAAEKLEQERNNLLEKRYDSHGTNVYCYEMNQAVEQLNVDLIYLAVLVKERGKLSEYDKKVKELLLPLEKCKPYIAWDDLYKCVRIAKVLPEGFCKEDEEYLAWCVKEVDESVDLETKRWENMRDISYPGFEEKGGW